MKILVLASTFPRWTNDTVPPFVFLLNEALSDLGFEMITLAPHYPGASFREELGGMKIYRFPYFFPFGLQRLCYDGGIMANLKKSMLAKIEVPFFLFMEFVSALYVCLKESPDIIHAHWIVPQGLVASVAAKLANAPMVLSAHGSDVFIFRRGRLRRLINFATKRAAVVTLNSSANFKALSEIDVRSKKIIIPMGIDTSRFSPAMKNRELKKRLKIKGLFLLAVGRLVELKGFNYLLDAMTAIAADLPESKLIIIGSGPELGNLKKQAKDLDLEEQVVFLGNIQNSELPEYYASADIFIGPSVETKDGAMEAFGIVFLEALASGAAVISTSSGGISDIVKDCLTGIVVPERDSKAIYQAVKKIIDEPALRARLRENGLRLAGDSYSWDKIGSQFADLYRNVHKTYEAQL
ncbi:MAG: hypothetical protein QOG91_469 [Candidatus Parcubacteria bacterium]|jgi:glycosyltransferase involved in cell wall biosynthesis|nr:hypothetical protein [Candidatus Parcubacteria bacterium]